MKKIIALLLTAIMLVSMTSVAFALDSYISPSGDDFYNIEVYVKDNKGGSASASDVTVKKGDTVTIKAKPDGENTFGGWTFSGEFDWISGDANSLEIVIRPKSHVVFTATFNGEGPNKDNGGKSPTTGYNTEAIIAVMSAIVLVSAAAVVYTGKKYFCAD